MVMALVPCYNRCPVPIRGATMKASLVIPVLAAASLTLLGCDTTPTAPQQSYRPSFITHGTLDGTAHPAVVLLVMDVNGTPTFRCSATLIAPKVVLTAGHCAGEPGEFSGMRIFTESDVQNGRNNYPVCRSHSMRANGWASRPAVHESALFP